MVIIVVHGGAAITEDKYIDMKLNGVKAAVKLGFAALASGRSALDGVEEAVRVMEDDPIMNCGFGSSLTTDGTVEDDAIIMNGKNLGSGAVAAVSRIRHPISLARAVMEKTEHCLMVGSGAELLAKEVGMELVDNKSLVHEIAQKRLDAFKTFHRTVNRDKPVNKQEKETSNSEDHDTVGAVAIDNEGNVAVATSTGGITAQRVGRVGDSPIIGAGGYADNKCGAVSTTGHGEAIMKTCLARHVMYEFTSGQNKTLQQSIDSSLAMMASRVDGYGGAIAVSNNGQIGVGFSTKMMSWAYINSADQPLIIHYGIHEGQHLTEKL